MADPDENAAIVNALQRHASVVVQKSLAEGFGLTVTEAMWKGGRSSPARSAASSTRSRTARRPARRRPARPRRRSAPPWSALLRDPREAERLASNARQRVTAEFLGDRHLEQYGRLFEQLRV